MKHYDARVPLDDQPFLVLQCERDLGINAGLQDRVIQTYEGAVSMDFSDETRVAATGAGRYERLKTSAFPELMLVWGDEGSDSGATHADVKRRWENGDAFVRETMAKIAAVAAEARDALTAGFDDAAAATRTATLVALMNENFDLRRAMFGDEALGARNIDMVMTRASSARGPSSRAREARRSCCVRTETTSGKSQRGVRGEGFKTARVVPNPAPCAA